MDLRACTLIFATIAAFKKYPAYLLRYPLAAKLRKVFKIEIPGSSSRASITNYIAIYVFPVIVKINEIVNFPGKILFKTLGILVDLVKQFFRISSSWFP
jgi:hypothetical protein